MKVECKRRIDTLLGDHAGVRRNGKVASDRTQEITREVVYASFRLLYEKGYKLEDPRNLRRRHVTILIRYWWEAKRSPKTIQNNMSLLRRFCRMMGREQVVGTAAEHLPDVDPAEFRVEVSARKSKAPSTQGIDVYELFRRADEKDARLGAMIRMEMYFGLRRIEALKFAPHVQDKGNYIELFPGQAKGGRPRYIHITSPEEREALNLVKSRVKKGEALGWPYASNGEKATLGQNVKRYANMMAAIGLTKRDSGITGHGLRAQFAENRLLKSGLFPSTLGGGRSALEREEERIRLRHTSEEIGHGRAEVMSPYVGPRTAREEKESRAIAVTTIQAAAEKLDSGVAVPEERLGDCTLLQDKLHEDGLDLTLRQIYSLWGLWSRRCGSDWANISQEVLFPLAAAARPLVEGTTT